MSRFTEFWNTARETWKQSGTLDRLVIVLGAMGAGATMLMFACVLLVP